MHLVYLVVFEDRKKSDIKPYYYIGSKSNCTYDGKNILDSKGKIYYGSSFWKDYNIICENEENIKTYILKSDFDEYQDCLIFEKEMHIKNDVVADSRFFNRSIATITTYSDPNYGSFRHSVTNKTVRLLKDHPMVSSGEYVNTNKGYKTYNNGIEERQFLEDSPPGWNKGRLEKNIKRSNENSFFGKTHSVESTSKIVSSRRKTYDEDPERYLEVIKILSETATKTFKGVPKTPESNAKRGRKDMIMLKNKKSGKTVRIHKSEKDKYDSNIWQNPYKVDNEGKPNGTKWCTDDIKNIKIKSGEDVPPGFRYGRTYKNWNENKRNQNEN